MDAAATSSGVAASSRRLATRSAGPVAGTWSVPPTVMDHRTGASARANPTRSGSIPHGSTSLPPVAVAPQHREGAHAASSDGRRWITVAHS